MTATVSNNKSYQVAPQDGWVEIVDATTTNLVFLRVSSYPHTHPFEVFTGTSAPTETSQGVYVCHHPFKVANYSNNNASKFWVKVRSPMAGSKDGRGSVRIDVYADGGVLQ